MILILNKIFYQMGNSAQCYDTIKQTAIEYQSLVGSSRRIIYIEHKQADFIHSTLPNEQFLPNAPLASQGTFVDLPYHLDAILKNFEFRGEPLTQVQLYRPFLIHSTNQIYHGQWQNHRPHGRGIIAFNQTNYIVGDFREGMAHGKCKVVVEDTIYQGEMIRGEAFGIGKYQRGQYIYEGEFKSNLQHGQGREQIAGKMIYKGKFENGYRKDGRLQLIQQDQCYQGQFKSNVFQGRGKLISSQGIYQGEFKKGKKHGAGVYRWKDGSIYQGQYQNDLKHGKGKYVASSGEFYQGLWVEGERNGQGHTKIENKQFNGVYKMGKLIHWTNINSF